MLVRFGSVEHSGVLPVVPCTPTVGQGWAFGGTFGIQMDHMLGRFISVSKEHIHCRECF